MENSTQQRRRFSQLFHQRAERIKKISSAISCLAAALVVSPSQLLASTSSLPWDGPIETISNGLQGPVAFMFALGGLIVLGVRWIFGGEMGTMTRALLTSVAGISLLVFAAGFLSQLFGVASITAMPLSQ